MHVVLMGLRGAGKSTVARLLAQSLSRQVIDLDDITAAVLGAATAGDALRIHGEPAFREAEACAVAAALSHPPAVIALGGGSPTAPRVADLLRRARAGREVWILYLAASPAALAARVKSDGATTRPSLTGLPSAAEVDKLFAQRDPLYQELADACVKTDRLSPAQASAEALRMLAAAGVM